MIGVIVHMTFLETHGEYGITFENIEALANDEALAFGETYVPWCSC